MKITRQQAIEILELTNKDPSKNEIKAAYHKHAMFYHPDKYEGDKQEGTEHFKKISLAYKKLTDDDDDDDEVNETNFNAEAFYQHFQKYFLHHFFYAHQFAHANYDESDDDSWDSSNYCDESDDNEQYFSRRRMHRTNANNNITMPRVSAEEAERNAAELIRDEEKNKKKSAKNREKKKKQRERKKKMKKLSESPTTSTTSTKTEEASSSSKNKTKEVHQVQAKNAHFSRNETSAAAAAAAAQSHASFDTSSRCVLSSCGNIMSRSTMRGSTLTKEQLKKSIIKNEAISDDNGDEEDYYDMNEVHHEVEKEETLSSSSDTNVNEVEDEEAELSSSDKNVNEVEDEEAESSSSDTNVNAVEDEEAESSSSDTNVNEVEDEEAELSDSSVDERMMNAGNQGNHYGQLGNLEDALKWFTKGLEEPRGSAEVRKILLGNRSLCFEQLGLFKEALQDADESLQLQSDWLKGWFRRGRALMGLNQAADAALAFKQILRLDPNNVDAAKELRDAEFAQLQAMGFDDSHITEAFLRGGPRGFSWALDFLIQKSQHPDHGPEFATVAAAGIPINEKLKTTSHSIAFGSKTEPLVVPSVATTLLHPKKNSSNVVSSKECDSNIDPSNKNRYCNLWVGNVNPRATELELTKLFSQCGTVLSVRIMPAEKYYAFVNFNSPDAASRALLALQGYRHYDSQLILKFQDNQRPASSDHPSNDSEDKECYYWRTNGCKNKKLCPFKHLPKSRGILLSRK